MWGTAVGFSFHLLPILDRVLQRNRTSRICINMYKRMCLTRTGSHGYGGQEVPQSTYCKLESQESWCYNSVHIWRLESLGANSVITSGRQRPKNWGAARVRIRVQGPENQEWWGPRAEDGERIYLSFDYLFYLGTQWTGWCPPTLVRADIFYSVSLLKC